MRIYYVTLSPTTLSYGTAIQVSAITSTNVSAVSLGYNGVSTTVAQTGPGQWRATFPFTFIGASTQGPISLTLLAAKADGTSASVPIGVTVVQQTSSMNTP